METFRVSVAFAVKQKLQIFSLDVCVAFLNRDIQEEFYMDQPQGYQDAKKPNEKCPWEMYLWSETNACW